jgi:hypothetical protein
MQTKINVFFFLSLFLNIIFIIFLVLALGKNVSSFAFYDIEKEGGEYLNAAAVISVPKTGTAVFGPLEITLEKGQKAAVQFSVIAGKNQINIANESVFDHRIISVDKTGYGIIITALETGDTVMQSFFDDGFRDFIKVTVTE